LWKRKQNTDGVRDASLRQNKKSYSCQRFQLTKEDDNTNAHSVGKSRGYKEEGHQPSLSIKIAIKTLNFAEKLFIQYHHLV
jgi:hypothetical protein